jgi:hypothetical protein
MLHIMKCVTGFGTAEDYLLLLRPMFIGHAHVSSEDQHLHLQIDILKKEGCEKSCNEMSRTNHGE